MKYDVCVIGGCGHAGLPLSIAFALRGKRCVIVDRDADAMQKVRDGVMPFMEENGQESLLEALKSGNLDVRDDLSVISQSDAVVLVVGTPIDSHLTPSFGAIDAVLEQHFPYFVEDQLVVLRSTLYPGTSERVVRWAERRGVRLHVATCPERIAEGFALREISDLPQLVGSFSSEGLKRAVALFSALTDDIIVLEPLEAELAKLFNNAWRYIKFATANQFFMIATECGADFRNVYQGMTARYPRGADLPGPGFAAGPCLFKDTMQLSALTNNQFFIGHASMLVNEGLPQFVIKQMKSRYPLRDMTVGILGMSFKANIDDMRDSLSLKLRDLLEMEAKGTICSDPFVHFPGFVDAEEAVRRADVLVVATPHEQYKTLQLHGKPVFDIWNVLPEQKEPVRQAS
jgi:UDP-N-acetyl-D-mannosaminuronic acid dehydrogenase